MTQDKVAKNLLEDKNCDTCQKLNHCTQDGKEYCGTGSLAEDLRRSFDKECKHYPLPKVRTCKDWKASEPFDLAKMMTPLIRRTYPKMVAAEIVSVQPIDVDMKSIIESSKNDDD